MRIAGGRADGNGALSRSFVQLLLQRRGGTYIYDCVSTCCGWRAARALPRRFRLPKDVLRALVRGVLTLTVVSATQWCSAQISISLLYSAVCALSILDKIERERDKRSSNVALTCGPFLFQTSAWPATCPEGEATDLNETRNKQPPSTVSAGH